MAGHRGKSAPPGTLAGGTFASVYAYRKQRVDEAASHRADAEQLSRRYQDAAAQLGHEHAPVRLAGIYAIAASPTTVRRTARCAWISCARTCACPTSLATTRTTSPSYGRPCFDVIRAHLTDL